MGGHAALGRGRSAAHPAQHRAAARPQPAHDPAGHHVQDAAQDRGAAGQPHDGKQIEQLPTVEEREQRVQSAQGEESKG